MKSHTEIDSRSPALARAIASKIDADPERRGLQRARRNCARWMAENPQPALAEWMEILAGDWPRIRELLLDAGETGQRLRQSNPFCGVLSPQERWAIYRRYSGDRSPA